MEGSQNLMAAIVCREMKWTLEEYQNSPTEFIDTLVEMLQAESRAQKQK